jgi:hypothetical protein
VCSSRFGLRDASLLRAYKRKPGCGPVSQLLRRRRYCFKR